jgi:hypothetical protein
MLPVESRIFRGVLLATLILVAPTAPIKTVLSQPVVWTATIYGIYCPEKVAPNQSFTAVITVEYWFVVHLPASNYLQVSVFDVDDNRLLASSERETVKGVGLKNFTISLTSPLKEKTWHLQAQASYGSWISNVTQQSMPKSFYIVILRVMNLAVIVLGVPSDLSVGLYVNDLPNGSLSTGQPRDLRLYAQKISVRVPQYVNYTSGTRYRCEYYSRNVSSSGTISFKYIAQHYLSVRSAYGTAHGSGWYDAGSTAEISISPTTVSLLGLEYQFAGWTGDVALSTPSATIEVDSPKVIIASWKLNFIPFFLILLAVGVICLLAIGIMLAIFIVHKKRWALKE